MATIWKGCNTHTPYILIERHLRNSLSYVSQAEAERVKVESRGGHSQIRLMALPVIFEK
jgi:hypothetical protein